MKPLMKFLSLVAFFLLLISISSYAQELKIDSVVVKNISQPGASDGTITVYVSGGTLEHKVILSNPIIMPPIYKVIETSNNEVSFSDLMPDLYYQIHVVDRNGKRTSKFNIIISGSNNQ